MKYTTRHTRSILCVSLICLLTSNKLRNILAFQVSPHGDGTDPPKLSPPQGPPVEGTLVSTAKYSFQSTSAIVPSNEDFETGLDDLLRNWSPPPSTSKAIGCLFVSPTFSSKIQAIVESAQRRLGNSTQFLTVVGGGVVGNGEEHEEGCGLSFLGGLLPEASSVEFFCQSDEQKVEIPSFIRSVSYSKLDSHDETKNKRKPSHLIFADPHCREIRNLLRKMDGIVAGGISIANPSQSSLAIGTKVMPPGSLIGATFTGNIGLEVVVTQGCRPVGDIFRVTNVKGPCVNELNSERAIDKLQEIMKEVMEGEMNIPNIKSDDFLGGIHPDEDTVDNSEGTKDRPNQSPHGFTLRQMTGFRPRSGSILICGPQIQAGDYFRFHVQSKAIALDDWQATLQQARTERIFLGEMAGNALGALQISCMGRGKSLFGVSNVDLRHIEQLLPPNTPISGLLANAEIGPVGIRLGTSEVCQSVLHGFASVVAMLCDYTDSSSAVLTGRTMTSCLGNSTEAGSWE